MSTELIHFFEGAGSGASQPVVAALLHRGCGLRVHRSVAGLVRALAAPVAAGAPCLVLLAGGPAATCRAAEAVRRVDAGVAIVALLPRPDQALLLRAMRCGIDACWPQAAAPPLVVAAVMRLIGRPEQSGPGSGHGGCDVFDGGPAWVLAWRGWVVQAPDGACISLTGIERSMLLALLEAPGQRLTHDEILAAVPGARPRGPQGGAAARRLSVLMSRMRRKFAATGHDMPIRSLRGSGYALCADFRVQAVAAAPVRPVSGTGP